MTTSISNSSNNNNNNNNNGNADGGEDDIVECLWSVVVPNTSRTNVRGNIRRSIDASYGPILSLYGCRTLYESFRHGASVNPLGPCLGFRAISNNTGFATPYIYSSYTEILNRVNCIAAGLYKLNLVRKNDNNLLLLGIYMKNCMEWVISEHAIYTIGGATVPFYDTLGPDIVQYILNHTGLKSLICSRAELPRVCEAKASGQCPFFTTAIIVDGITPDCISIATKANVELISFAKVEAIGSEYIAANVTAHHGSTNFFHNPPNSNDIATFCYTSGTTGMPKAAMLSHANLISTAGGTIASSNGILLECTIHDRHISYLPLPHIFERVVMTNFLAAGGSVAFYRGGDPSYLIEDIVACQPTFLPVAPRVLNKIYDKIYTGVNTAGGSKKKIFNKAVAAKTYNLLHHGKLTHPLYDRLIFNKIKKALGFQHLRGMLSGSAPLSSDVMIFFRILLGVPVVEGYGQTEGSAAATIAHPHDVSTAGHVGGPTPTTEICLYDVPEMGYLHTDTFHNTGAGSQPQPCYGRGEICIRGPNVFVGYYKDIEKTNETIDDEGWLHSGDIGLWRPDGSLQIIDRKKNLFKLAQGEYVAPEKIENILVRSSYIAQCFVYGDSYQSYLIAIIIPDEENIQQWYKNNNADHTNKAPSFDELCKNTTLKHVIFDDIIQISKDAKLNGFETVRNIYISSSPFSVENDLMTPTFKLKRKEAREAYHQQIEQLYNDGPMPMTSKL